MLTLSFMPRWTITQHWWTNWSDSSRRMKNWKLGWTSTWQFRGNGATVLFAPSPSLPHTWTLSVPFLARPTPVPPGLKRVVKEVLISAWEMTAARGAFTYPRGLDKSLSPQRACLPFPGKPGWWKWRMLSEKDHHNSKQTPSRKQPPSPPRPYHLRGS